VSGQQSTLWKPLQKKVAYLYWMRKSEANMDRGGVMEHNKLLFWWCCRFYKYVLYCFVQVVRVICSRYLHDSLVFMSKKKWQGLERWGEGSIVIYLHTRDTESMADCTWTEYANRCTFNRQQHELETIGRRLREVQCRR